MPSDFQKNKPVYYLAVFAFLFYVLLKLPLWTIVAVTLQALIFLSPLLVLLTVGGLYLWRSGKDPDRKLLIRKDYLALTAKLLLVILAFYLLYAPGTLPALLLSLAGFIRIFFTLDSFFFLFGYILTIVTVGAGVFLAVRAFQKSRGLYPRSVSELIRRTLYALFLVYLLFFASSALAYPQAYAPFTSTLGDILYTYSGGSIKVLNGSDNYAYKKLGSLTQAAQALTASIGQTKAGLTTTLNQNSAQFRQNLAVTQDTLSESLAKTQKNLSDQLSSDINTRLDMGGGTLTGDLKVKGKLQSTDNLTAPNVIYSLSGTAGRVTISAGQTPTVDIADDYAGQPSITTLGTVTTGTWEGTPLADAYVASAAVWNAKQNAYSNLTSIGQLADAAGWLYDNGAGTFSYSTPVGLLSGLDSGYVPYATSGTALGNSGIYYDSSNGNVGIGTASPGAALDVAGAANTSEGYEIGGKLALFSSDAPSNTTWVGVGAGSASNTGTYNTAVGSNTFYSNTTGSQNTVLGVYSLISNTTGSNNTALGQYAMPWNSTGSGNTAVGESALTTNVTGSNNTAVGFGANVLGNGLTNATAIGYNAQVGESNALVLGGTGSNAVDVGIGTTSPGYALDVAGNIHSVLGIYSDTIYYSKNYKGNNGFVMNGANLYGAMSNAGGNVWSLGYSATQTGTTTSVLSWNNSGNVGIGTTSPGAKLEVNGNVQLSGSIPTLYLNGSEANAKNIALYENAGVFKIDWANSQNIFSINGATGNAYIRGNVGIGTTSPGRKLDVQGAYSTLQASLTDTWNLAPLGISDSANPGVGLKIGNTTGYVPYLQGASSSSGAMNVLLNPFGGNVGIGTTNPTHALEVNGDVEVSGNFIQNGTTLAVPDYVFQPNYNLMPLADLQTYINTNSHLPGVPSEADIQKNGLNTGSMILDLLQSTEENVLYILGNHNDIQTLAQLVNTNSQGEASTVATLQASLASQQSTLNQQQSVLSSLNDQALSTGSKIALIGTTLDQITANQTDDESKLKAVSDTLDAQAQTITSLQTNLETLESQMATLQQENQAVIDFATALNTNSLIYKDSSGNLDLGQGQLQAAGVVAGAFTVKVVDPAAKTIGWAAICPSGQIFGTSSGQCSASTDSGANGTTVEIKTTAVEASSRIYITPVGSTGNQVVYVDQTKPGEGFEVKVDNPTKEEIIFNWWVVQENDTTGDSVVPPVSSAATTNPTGSTTAISTTSNPSSATSPSSSPNPTNSTTPSTNTAGADTTTGVSTGSTTPSTGGVTGTLHAGSASGPALAGATVSCGGKSAVTASDGAYTLDGIAAGSETLSFAEAGYEPHPRSITITPGQTLDSGDNYLSASGSSSTSQTGNTSTNSTPPDSTTQTTTPGTSAPSSGAGGKI